MLKSLSLIPRFIELSKYRKFLIPVCCLALMLISCERTGVNLIITPDELSIKEGHSATLVVTMLADTLSADVVQWSSSCPEVAAVKDGTVAGLSVGTAVISANAMGTSVSAKVTVTPTDSVPVEDFVMTPSSLTLEVGNSDTIVATYLSGEKVEHATWHSTNNLIVYVDDAGVVTALQEGSAIISVVLVAPDKKYVGNCTVTVPKRR